MFLRLHHLLTKQRMTQSIVNCLELNDIFSSTDPDYIANNIQINLNAIIDMIAPVKKVM